MECRLAIRRGAAVACLLGASAVLGSAAADARAHKKSTEAVTTGVTVDLGPAAATSTTPAAGAPAGAPPPPGGGFRPVFGQVVAVRGNVLQMHSGDAKGLTRVILAGDARILSEETLTVAALQPGTGVSGSGRAVDGTGEGAAPLQVEVQSLQVKGGVGDPFSMMFGGGGPLLRGQSAQVFRKENYSGKIVFDGKVKSTNPLVLTDDEGNVLPVVIPADVPVKERNLRPVKEGDIAAGSTIVALGGTAPDGLLTAHLVVPLSSGQTRSSQFGTITSLTDTVLKVRPRFAPEDLSVSILPAAKYYYEDRLDPDTIQIGDSLRFTGRVFSGTAAAPTVLVVSSISPADGDLPDLDTGGDSVFMSRPAKATIKGKVTGFDPFRVQTEDGREVTLQVPGQLSYVSYRAVDRSALKTGNKIFVLGKTKEDGFDADLVLLNPSPALGSGF